jgi:hypothetical protein
MILFGYAVVGATRGPGRDAITALELPDAVTNRENWEWLDFYASADPVPNGPLLESDSADLRPLVERLHLKSTEVYNLGSLWSDHTAYWRNCDHFVGAVACAIARLAKLDQRCLWREENLEIARHRRGWRVGWLVAARWSAIGIALGMPVLLWKWDRLPSSPSDLPFVLKDWFTWAMDHIASAGKWLPFEEGSMKSAVLQSRIVRFTAAMTVPIFALVGYFSLYAVWRWWEEREISRFFSRNAFEMINAPFAVFLLLYELALMAAIGWIYVPHNLNALRAIILVLGLSALFPAILAFGIQLLAAFAGHLRGGGGGSTLSLYLGALVIWFACFLLVSVPPIVWAVAEWPSATADDLVNALVSNPVTLAYVIGGFLLVCTGGLLIGAKSFLRRWFEDLSYAKPITSVKAVANRDAACPGGQS